MRLPLLALCLACLQALQADEGMWTFDNVPAARIKAKYGFEPTAPWLKRLQLATLRFPGGTGSFVSADGLVITNHHVGRGGIAQVSSAQADYIQDGFMAATREQEVKVPGLTLEMLVDTRNVTEAVLAAGRSAHSEAAAVKARKDAHAKLVAESQGKDGLVSQAVILYQGGEYWIYRYRRFSDVRLVMAPEEKLADFGHDADNYSYPRYSLDFTLFRIYENGQPYHPEAYLPFASTPLKNGDVTLISGHPGSTFRQWTVAQMKEARDFTLPWSIRSVQRQERAMAAYGRTSAEAHRLATEELKGLANARKRNIARLKGLQSQAAMEKAEKAEAELKTAVAKDSALAKVAGESWGRIEKVLEADRRLYVENSLLTTLGSSRQPLVGFALDLVRFHGERALPLDRRLASFRDEAAVRRRIESPKPLDAGLETARLASALAELQEELGSHHALVKALLNGQSAEARAQSLVEGSRLRDLAFRKALLEGSADSVNANADPLLAFARTLDPLLRANQARMEREVTDVVNEHATRLAEARFKVFGKAQYPDATFTLRLSYGTVETYDNGVGAKAQPFTTFAGLYDRHWGWGGNASEAEGGQWKLPQRWLDRRDRLDLATPFNFIYSCDTVGGNSGSPVVNPAGEFVGINFDSVYEGQGGYYIYDADTKRAVAADARAILETLRKIADAPHLVKELTGK